MTTVTFPAHKLLYNAASIQGAARALYFYWPSFQKRLTIPEMEHAGDLRCFHLDERLKTNPGFLGETAVQVPSVCLLITVTRTNILTVDSTPRVAPGAQEAVLWATGAV